VTASLQRAADGHWRVTGTLDFDTVVDLRPRLREALTAGAEVALDLSGVTRANSAGLALLLQWKEDAQRRNATLAIRNVPAALADLAGLSNLRKLLSLNAG
jgi:phospholipid transport system transporter-binding protein